MTRKQSKGTKKLSAHLQNLERYSTNTLKATASNPLIRPVIRNRAKTILRRRLGVQRLHLKHRERG